jgi:RNA polymerase sigma factor (sigma-70 family)
MKYSNEQELILDLMNKKQSAFEFLYTEYQAQAIQIIRQKGGSEEEARDIFQEAIIALWQNMQQGSFQKRSNVKLNSYLIQICKFKWYDKLKKSSTKNELPLEEGVDFEGEHNSLNELISNEYIARAQRLFAKLGDNCQKILTLFYYEELKMERIAELMGTKTTSVTNQKYRCLQRLKSLNKPA